MAFSYKSNILIKKFPKFAVDFIFFTDEKIFWVASPANTHNERAYAPSDARKHQIAAKRLLCCGQMSPIQFHNSIVPSCSLLNCASKTMIVIIGTAVETTNAACHVPSSAKFQWHWQYCDLSSWYTDWDDRIHWLFIAFYGQEFVLFTRQIACINWFRQNIWHKSRTFLIHCVSCT